MPFRRKCWYNFSGNFTVAQAGDNPTAFQRYKQLKKLQYNSSKGYKDKNNRRYQK